MPFARTPFWCLQHFRINNTYFHSSVSKPCSLGCSGTSSSWLIGSPGVIWAIGGSVVPARDGASPQQVPEGREHCSLAASPNCTASRRMGNTTSSVQLEGGPEKAARAHTGAFCCMPSIMVAFNHPLKIHSSFPCRSRQYRHHFLLTVTCDTDNSYLWAQKWVYFSTSSNLSLVQEDPLHPRKLCILSGRSTLRGPHCTVTTPPLLLCVPEVLPMWALLYFQPPVALGVPQEKKLFKRYSSAF